MAEHVDIAIIGAGPGGYSTALRAAELGETVALVERDATLGGTCLNRGCIPSKALITATREMDAVAGASRFGIEATLQGIDFAALRDYKLRIVDTMTRGVAGLLAHRGVTVYRGKATLTGNANLAISPSGTPGESATQHVQRFITAGVPEDMDGAVELTADHIVLATGSAPKPLPGNPFAGALIDSTQALSLNQFPASAIIIGAGAIAVESACMWSAAGTKVTMLIRKDHVLSNWDRRTGIILTREMERRGITVITHARVSHVDTGVNLGATVHFSRGGADGDQSLYAEIALAAIGREPQTRAEWFSSNAITLDGDGYVVTDEHGRTNLAHVWAVGDITRGPALAHRAFEQGIVIAESIAGLNPKPVDDVTVPRVVFSSPEAASVGLTYDEAKSRDDLSEVSQTLFPMLSNARMLMSDSAGSLIVVSGVMSGESQDAGETVHVVRNSGPKESDIRPTPVVLGVHMVCPDASDLIAEAEQLVGNHVPLSEAARLVHPHPTLSETLGEALLKADGRPLHTR